MLWVWANERAGDHEARIEGTPAAIEQANLSFDDGARITRDVPDIEMIRDGDSPGTLTDNLIAPGVRGLVFSSRLRSVLAQIGVDNIDYYPMRVVDSFAGKTLSDYEIANVVGSIECVDRDNSDLEMHPDFPDRIEYVNSLALRPSAIGAYQFFRVAEMTQIIIVSDPVKESCERAGITGVRFYDPAEFSL